MSKFMRTDPLGAYSAPHPAVRHLCGVRLSLRGPLRWVHCDGTWLRPGLAVTAEIAGNWETATVVVGCGQILENEAGAHPEGRVLGAAAASAGVSAVRAAMSEDAAAPVREGGADPTAAALIEALFPLAHRADSRRRPKSAASRDQDARHAEGDGNDAEADRTRSSD